MEHAELVTFGGSGAQRAEPELGRAAHLRDKPDDLIAMLGLYTPLWQGKVALHQGQSAVWLPLNHPVFALGESPVFLGLVNGMARFAIDISRWTPEIEPMQAGFLDQTQQVHPDLPDDTAFFDLRMVMTALSALDAECLAIAKGLMNWHASHGFCAACGQKTDISHAGWQRHCVACGRSHFPRTDPVVIMLVVSQNRLLLGRSAQWPAGMYSLLAGFVEPGEVIEAAVRREVYEESGIRIGKVRYLASQPWVFPASLMIGCICEAQTTDIKIDPTELEDAQWVTREDLVSIKGGSHPVIKPGRHGAIAQFLIESWLQDRIA
jgi:NAD+ diphosphatase